MDQRLQTLAALARRMRTDVSAYRGPAGKIGKHSRRLTIKDLQDHLAGRALRGQYFIKPGETLCSVAVLDLDSHKGDVPWEKMLGIAWMLAARLRLYGLLASPWRSSGGSGIHLILNWTTPQDAFSVRSSLKEILRLEGFADGTGGVAKGEIEIFPKQDAVREGGYGNYVWLPMGGKSVPLVDAFVGDGWRAGSLNDVDAGFDWPVSAAVELKARPAKGERPKAANDGMRISPLTAPEKEDLIAESLLLNRLREMLFSIKVGVDGDYDYKQWMNMAFAVHHATGGSDAGLGLWAEWSGLGASCPDWEALAAKWASIRNDGADGSAVVTIKSLEHAAREGGWAENISEMFEDLTAGQEAAIESVAPIIQNERDHLGIARKLAADKFSHEGFPCLWRSAASGDWFAYDGRVYARELDEIITNRVRLWLSSAKKVIAVKKKKPKKEKGQIVADSGDVADEKIELTIPFDPTPAQIVAVLGALKTVAAPWGRLDPPCWLDHEGRTAPGVDNEAGAAGGHIVLEDGILNLKDRALQPHTPAFFSVNALPYAWGSGADVGCPLWLKFLSEVFPDQESVDCLQEIVGYLVSGATSLQKMFFIRGLPRSGKGTIERVVRSMLGAHNVAGATLNQLGEDFGLWPLIDKSAVFISEARNTGRGGHGGNRMGLAVERLLMISGEDSVMANVKGGRYYEGRLNCRIVMTGNEVPALGDSTGALASRFITLTTQGSWLGREDSGLTEKLCTEMAGILRWSLDGLDRLSGRGRFIQPASGAEVMEDLADAQNPIRRFLKDECEFKAGGGVVKQELYTTYKYWFADEGFSGSPTSQNWFAKALSAAYREACGKELVATRADKYAKWQWSGVTLKVKK